MEMIAHSPKMAKKAGVPQAVGKEFAAADKGRSFKVGGKMAAKKGKFSVYNDANKTIDRTMDGSKSVPKSKKGKSDAASAKTFSTKIKATKKK